MKFLAHANVVSTSGNSVPILQRTDAISIPLTTPLVSPIHECRISGPSLLVPRIPDVGRDSQRSFCRAWNKRHLGLSLQVRHRAITFFKSLLIPNLLIVANFEKELSVVANVEPSGENVPVWVGTAEHIHHKRIADWIAGGQTPVFARSVEFDLVQSIVVTATERPTLFYYLKRPLNAVKTEGNDKYYDYLQLEEIHFTAWCHQHEEVILRNVWIAMVFTWQDWSSDQSKSYWCAQCSTRLKKTSILRQCRFS